MYIDKLSDIVKRYKNTYYKTIKMKPVDAKSEPYINFNKENNYKDSKFKVGDYVRISKHKKVFEKDHVSNWSKAFAIKKN